jgi:hypothetical protein
MSEPQDKLQTSARLAIEIAEHHLRDASVDKRRDDPDCPNEKPDPTFAAATNPVDDAASESGWPDDFEHIGPQHRAQPPQPTEDVRGLGGPSRGESILNIFNGLR